MKGRNAHKAHAMMGSAAVSTAAASTAAAGHWQGFGLWLFLCLQHSVNLSLHDRTVSSYVVIVDICCKQFKCECINQLLLCDALRCAALSCGAMC
jgi:hypothetical protein